MEKFTVGLKDAPPRSVVAQDVFDDKGTFLLSKDSTLNSYIVRKLEDYGVEKVAIYNMSEKAAARVCVEKDFSANRFVAHYDVHVHEMRKLMSDLASGEKVDLPKFEEVAASVYDEAQSCFSVVECLNELRTADDYAYAHSVNVSIYGMLIAKWLDLSDEQIRDVTLAGVLHDIGKSRIPQSILRKKGPLEKDEYEFMKKHPALGYNMVKDIAGLKDEVKEVVLMHHERRDGSGYPMGVTEDDLNLYTKIISIADVFDAMTSEKAYKKRITPFDTFNRFQLEGYEHFDTKIMLTFLSNISTYYLGCQVRLNSGEVGEVAYMPPTDISHPIVKVGDNYIDLRIDKDYAITEML